MEKQAISPKMIRQRKFILIVPLLALPFITMIFWALGGGKTQHEKASVETVKGFNLSLPDANLKEDNSMDKMSYYDKAQLDSMKFRELVKNDPNYQDMAFEDIDGNVLKQSDSIQLANREQGLNTSLYGRNAHSDPNADKIYNKLAELDRELSKPVSAHSDDNYEPSQYSKRESRNKSTVNSADVDKLEQMMNSMNQPAGEDPELQQLNGMLEKILDVQHPERVQEKIKQSSSLQKKEIFAVAPKTADNSITHLSNEQITGKSLNGFFSPDNTVTTQDPQNTIQAVIDETKTVVNSSIVKLRLINDVVINEVRIPKGNFLFGIASLNGERLNIKINSVRFNNAIFPVELSAYDLDGLNGIYIPGSIARDVAKQSADRSIQPIGLTSLEPSLEAQAASAGIEAAKTLFSQKVKLIKVTVKAGYQVLLRDENQHKN